MAVNDLVTELESANISCAATITFAETDFKDQLKMLRVCFVYYGFVILHTHHAYDDWFMYS